MLSMRRLPLKLVFVALALLAPILGNCQSDGEGGHESWEYALVSTGDVLQLAIPATGLTVTLIEGD